jgi:hypothetical protein
MIIDILFYSFVAAHVWHAISQSLVRPKVEAADNCVPSTGRRVTLKRRHH